MKSLLKTWLCIILTIPALMLSGQNFINGDFENNTAGGFDQINMSNAAFTAAMSDVEAFGTTGNMDIITSGTWGGSGAQSGSYYVSFTGGGTDMISIELTAPLVAGNSYTFTFWDRADPGFTAFPTELGISNSSTAFGTSIYVAPVAPTDNVWTQRTVTFVAPITGSFITVQQSGPSSVSNWSHCDNFSFNCGQSINLGNDTNLCTGQSLLLDATIAGATYVWQNGSTNNTFNVTTSGTYYVDVSHQGCLYTDTINVSIINNPTIFLGNDTTICSNPGLTLDASSVSGTYLWSDGSTNPTLLANAAG
ncbi:MAG: carbohydrate binding domain-containing protein, partial [Flavobacteriales bacterium]|nr:carbohydrate binding domain-containing protein [Flavobacteriales bacterium]